MRLVRKRSHDESGAFLILWVVALAGLVGIAAFAVDLGQLRAGGRFDQSVADLAALAAGKAMSENPPDYLAACESVIDYLSTNANAPQLGAIDPLSFCTEAGNDVTKTVCSGGAIAEAEPSVSLPPYTVSVHFPVPATEISDSHYGTGLNDGTACQRLRVIVSKAEPVFFGAGAGYHGLVATRSATLRAAPGGSGDIPALWLLDPFGCTSLAVSGGSQVSIGTATQAGLISIDSDGTTCNSNQVTISVSGTGTSVTALNSGSAQGEVSLQALPPGATVCSAPACDPSDVSSGRLSPQPTNQPARSTRMLVDARYNCGIRTIDYYGLTLNETCTSAPPYISSLISTIGTSGLPPGGFQQWSPTYSCSPNASMTVSGNWWVNCPSGFSLQSGVSIDFTNGNVVFDGGISMSSSTSSLQFNSAGNPDSSFPSSCDPPALASFTDCTGYSSASQAFVFLRSGNISVSGGTLAFNHAMVYQASGSLTMSGSSQPPTWIAPTQGAFTGLAFWSEFTGSYTINGGASVSLDGVFFMPGATPLKLTGGGNWGQVHAQLITRQLAVSGGGILQLSPDPAESIGLLPIYGELIR